MGLTISPNVLPLPAIAFDGNRLLVGVTGSLFSSAITIMARVICKFGFAPNHVMRSPSMATS